MPTPVISRVLVVGAGIAGMSLAIGLKRSGISLEMVEIDPDLNFKRGNLREYMKARGVQAAE